MAFEQTLHLVPRLSPVTLERPEHDTHPSYPATLWARIRTWLRQASCGLSGHDHLLSSQGGRMCLRCWNCGHETPGWTFDAPRPVKRYAGDPERHRLQRVTA
jgi:hypothetical protein